MQSKGEANYNYTDLMQLSEKAVCTKHAQIKETHTQVCAYTQTEYLLVFPKLCNTLRNF